MQTAKLKTLVIEGSVMLLC